MNKNLILFLSLALALPSIIHPKAQAVQPCGNDKYCSMGNICKKNKCEPGCRDDSNCYQEQKCVTSKSKKFGFLTRKECTAQQCSIDSDCGSGLVKCLDGQCAANCTYRTGSKWGFGCEEGGQICDKQNRVCKAGCDQNYPCPAGQLCSADGTDGTCVPGCNNSHPCPAGQLCTNNSCVAGCDESHPCPDGLRCKKGQCASTACTHDITCPKGEKCLDGTCGVPECTTFLYPCEPPRIGRICKNHRCVRGCNSLDDCPVGLICWKGKCSR